MKKSDDLAANIPVGILYALSAENKPVTSSNVQGVRSIIFKTQKTTRGERQRLGEVASNPTWSTF